MGIATLARVELATTQTYQYKNLSEQNALLALNIAIGELQNMAGPDQRSTARADILTDLSTSQGKPAEGKGYLTGVWSNEPVANGTGDMQFLGWLVSGAPEETGANMSDWHTRPWSGDTVVLIGDETADNDNARGNNNAFAVSAQKVEIAGGSGDIFGHYAYWVGDEGLKAKLNMIESSDELAAHPSAEETFNRLHAIQKVNPSILEIAAGLDYDDEQDRNSLRRASSRGLFELIDRNASANAPSMVKSGFHDYALSSAGLLTNALQGGLKTDLTRGLDDQPLAGKLFDDSGDDKPAPRWELLKSYYGLKNEVSGNSISVRGQTDTAQGIYPVLLADDMAYGFYFQPIASTTNYQLHAIIWTAVVLHNPYDVAIAPADYIFESNNLPELPKNHLRFTLSKDGSVNRFFVKENVSAATGTTTRYVRYMTKEPIGFAPGEVKVLSMQAENNFAIGGFYNASNMPDEARVMAPGYRESTGYLMIPLTRNFKNDNANSPPHLTYPDGIFEREDLIDETNPANPPAPYTMAIACGGKVSLNVYAVTPNGGEAYIGGITQEGSGTVASGVQSRDTIPDIPIGVRVGGARTLLPRSSGGYGWRLLADFNYRSHKNPGDESVAYTFWNGGGNWLSGGFVNTAMGSNSITYNSSDDDAAFAGRSIREDGEHEVVLFSVPRENIFSLGDLRHANLRSTLYLGSNGNAQDYTIPTYVVGNSWANMFMPLNAADYTYRVNEALWDQYFFSSIPAGTTDWSAPFPNARIVPGFLNPDNQPDVDAILDRDEAAGFLAVDGAFNVNSTSVAAWRAVLGGLSDIVDDPDAAGETLDNIFPRITNWAFEDYHSGDIGNNTDTSKIPRMWSGFRSLSDDELETLAERIVEQVKLRGPFPSVASFVNRTLTDKDPVASPDTAPGGNARLHVLVDQHDTRLKGTLQAAIDHVDVNGDGLPDINEDLRQADYQESLGSAVTAAFATGVEEPLGIIDQGAIRTDQTYDGLAPKYRENSYGYFSTDAPGFLSQTDILAALAPLMTVRSDTFTIRCYGDAVNPLTGQVESRTWCEALVQRTPEGIDPNDPAAGRRFRVVNFRWLDEDDV
ncbi:MAG: hypothetical protein Q7Q73_15705 [Verrucomicrobiota bacterium JB024]|nr:hypothetical protein [Verrucomicrobiota bacterium JB024]